MEEDERLDDGAVEIDEYGPINRRKFEYIYQGLNSRRCP